MTLSDSNILLKFISIYKKFSHRILLLENHNFSIVLFVLFYVGLVVLLFGHSYSTNDDVALLYDVQNGYAVSFMSVALGAVLSYFYLHVNPNIPWYGLFLYTVHIISVFLFIKSLLRINKFKYLILPFLLLYLLCYSEFIFRISYNNAGVLLGANSLFVFLVNANDKKKSLLIIAILGILVGLSFLIRTGTFFAAVSCSFPIFIMAMFRKRIDYGRFAVLTFSVILVIFVNFLISKSIVSEKYKEYEKFNQLRYGFHYCPIANLNINNQKLFQVNNWTKQDYVFFTRNIFIDERKFNIKSMENIFKYSVPKPTFSNFFKHYFRELKKLYQDYQMFWFVLIAIFAAALNMHIFDSIIVSLYSFYIISGSIFLSLFYRFPSHIARPIFLCGVGFIISLFYFGYRKKRYGRYFEQVTWLLSGVIFFIFFTLGFIQLYNYSEKIKTEVRLTATDFNKLNKQYPNKVVLLFTAEPFNYIDSLSVSHVKFGVIPFGWKTFSPIFYKIIEKELGAKYGYEILSRCIDNNKAILLLPERTSSEIFRYFQSSLHLEAEIKKVDELSRNVNIYKLVSKK